MAAATDLAGGSAAEATTGPTAGREDGHSEALAAVDAVDECAATERSAEAELRPSGLSGRATDLAGRSVVAQTTEPRAVGVFGGIVDVTLDPPAGVDGGVRRSRVMSRSLGDGRCFGNERR
jgi:hypothetical protein